VRRPSGLPLVLLLVSAQLALTLDAQLVAAAPAPGEQSLYEALKEVFTRYYRFTLVGEEKSFSTLAVNTQDLLAKLGGKDEVIETLLNWGVDRDVAEQVVDALLKSTTYTRKYDMVFEGAGYFFLVEFKGENDFKVPTDLVNTLKEALADAYLAKYHPRAEPTLWYIKPGVGAPSSKVAEFLKSNGVAVTRITDPYQIAETLDPAARGFYGVSIYSIVAKLRGEVKKVWGDLRDWITKHPIETAFIATVGLEFAISLYQPRNQEEARLKNAVQEALRQTQFALTTALTAENMVKFTLALESGAAADALTPGIALLLAAVTWAHEQASSGKLDPRLYTTCQDVATHEVCFTLISSPTYRVTPKIIALVDKEIVAVADAAKRIAKATGTEVYAVTQPIKAVKKGVTVTCSGTACWASALVTETKKYTSGTCTIEEITTWNYTWMEAVGAYEHLLEKAPVTKLPTSKTTKKTCTIPNPTPQPKPTLIKQPPTRTTPEPI
jgi:hypothetical protein